MNQPGLLANLEFLIEVKVDPASLKDAVRAVDRALQSGSRSLALKVQIPQLNVAPLTSSLRDVSSAFSSSSEQISGALQAALKSARATYAGLATAVPQAPQFPASPAVTPAPRPEGVLARAGAAAAAVPPVYVPGLFAGAGLQAGIAEIRSASTSVSQALEQAIRETSDRLSASGIGTSRAFAEASEAIQQSAGEVAAAAEQYQAVSESTANAMAAGASAIAGAGADASARIEESTAKTAEAISGAGRSISDSANAVSQGAESLQQSSRALEDAASEVRKKREITADLKRALEAMNITPSAAAVREAASLIKDGTLTMQEALAALRLGFTEPAMVLKAVGEAAGASVDDLNNAKEAFARLDAQQIAKVGEQLRLTTNAVGLAFNTAVSRMASAASRAGTAGVSLSAIISALKASLSAMGVTVRSSALKMAALYIQQGAISFDDAVKAIGAGANNASETIQKLAGSASNAAKILANALRQLYGIAPAVPPTPPTPPPEGPPTIVAAPQPLPPPDQVLQLAGAMSVAGQAGRGLMRALMTLRWQLFTIMFFIFGVTRALKALGNVAKSSAATIDRVSSAVTILRARGVQDVDALTSRLVEASGYFLTIEEAARKLSRVAIIGLPPELMEFMPRLMEIARAVAVLSDEYGTAEQVFDKFVDAIARGQMRMAATTGAVSGTMEDALDRFKKFVSVMDEAARQGTELPEPLRAITQMLIDADVATKSSVESLSEYQKSLLITWTIMSNGEQVLKGLGTEFDRNTVQLQVLNYSWKELTKTIKTAISQFLGLPTVARVASESARARIGDVAMVLDRLFAPERYAKRMAEAERKADEIIARTTEEQRLRWEQGRLRVFAFGPPIIKPIIWPWRKLREELIRQAYLGTVVFETQAQAAKEADSALIDYIERLREILTAGEGAADATEELTSSIQGLQSSLGQFAEVYVNYMQELEDAELEHQRWLEDLMRDYHRRLAALENDADRDREKERADRDKRRRDAAADLARRLWEIEQNLAARLLNIWRDYNDEMFMAELDRDALRAFLAARRRDREITEAREAAERERQEAYLRYQDQLRDIEEGYRRRIAEIEQRMRNERERIEQWLQRETEDRALYERRQEEDRRRNFERRFAEMLRSRMLEIDLQRIMNDRSLSEEQRFMQMAQAIFTAYNASFAEDAKNTYRYLQSGAQLYFDWLWFIFRSYYEQMLRYRNAMAPLLTAPLVPGGQIPTPPPTGRYPQVLPRASGGVDIVTSPTRFLMGEAGPELVVAIPLRGPVARLSHDFKATIETAAGNITGRVNAAVLQTLETVLGQVM